MSLLSGIGSILGGLGGLFGKKKSGPQVVESRVDYQRMVTEAEAAGFNPLTAIRNGGSAGFSTQTTHPALASTGFLGGATDAIASIFDGFAQIDPMKDKRDELEYDLVQAQLGNIQADTEQKRRSFNVPSYSGGQRISTENGLTGVNSGRPVTGSAKLGAIATPSAGDVSVTNPWDNAKVDPTARDAEMGETRYGDILSNVIGAKNLILDAGVNGADGMKWLEGKVKKGLDHVAEKQTKRVKEQQDAARARSLQRAQSTSRNMSGGAW